MEKSYGGVYLFENRILKYKSTLKSFITENYFIMGIFSKKKMTEVVEKIECGRLSKTVNY